MKLVLPRNGSPHFHTLDFFSFAEKEGGNENTEREGGKEKGADRESLFERDRLFT